MRINSFTSMLIVMIALAVFATTGCDNKKEAGGKVDPHAGHDHDENDHDDDDHPAHGPFGGHIFDLDSDDYQGEWKKYKDNNIIRMYVLDGAGKKAAPIKVDSFTVTPMVGSDDTGFTLEADEPDENGLSAVYSLDDKDLSIAIPLGVKIEIKSGDETYKGEIKEHKPLDH